jgi:hypothetical protein
LELLNLNKMATKKMTAKSAVKKYDDGGQTGFEKRQARKIAKAKTKAAVAEIEGEGTVAQKRNNRADRTSVVLGTKREKTPKSVSTSTSTSTSNTNVDNRNSGNTSNTTNSGSSSNAGSSSTSSSNSKSGSSSTTPNSPRTGSGPNPTTGRRTPRPGRPIVGPPSMQKKGGPTKATYKTGGMVNANSKVSAIKSAGSKGTKVGLNKRVPKPGKKC